MSSESIVIAKNVGKAYQIFERYDDRLKQVFFGKFRDYHKKYWALRSVSLEIGKGECVGFVGRNGSGKTTFLQLVCGITRPTTGDLKVVGRIAPILALGSSFDMELSGRENSFIAGAMLGISRKKLDERIGAIEEFAGLGDFFDQPVKLYSSGMQARVAFAVCTQSDADILVVDEALSVGDGAFQAKCLDFIERFRNNGGTLLFVSHSADTTSKICDRVVWLDRGVVRMIGTPGEVIPAYENDLVTGKEPEKRFQFATEESA